MNMKDVSILERCHGKAVSEMGAAAVAIAELVVAGKPVPKDFIGRYKIARLGCESTRRDIIEIIADSAMNESY